MGDSAAGKASSRDYRLLPAAVGTWVGALAGLSGLPAPVFMGLLGAGAVGAGAAASAFRRRKAAAGGTARTGLLKWGGAIGAAALAAALSFGVAGLALAGYRSDPATRIAQMGGVIRAEVIVTGQPTEKEPFRRGGTPTITWVEAETVAVKDGPEWDASHVQLVVETDGAVAMSRGDRLRVFGPVKTGFRSDPPFIGVLRARSVVVVAPASGWQGAANRVRQRLSTASEGLPPNTRGLIAGMSIGDDRLLEPELKEAMRTASLTHLTAVSGSHIAVVLALLAVVLPGVRWLRVSATLVFLLLLVAVVGPAPSVLRAAWSAAIVGWGMVLGRGTQSQAVLSAVVTATLLVSPWMARSFGFALSALATWGILFSGRAWLELVASDPLPNDSSFGAVIWHRASTGLKQAAAISLSAQIWVFPVTLLMNPWLPTFGVLANVAVLPAVAPLTVLGLLAAASSAVPAAASFLCALARPFAAWMEFVAMTCASLPGARLPWPEGFLGVGAAVMLIGLVVAATKVAQKRGGQAR